MEHNLLSVLTIYPRIFNRATLCVSADIAVVAWLSVCHTSVLYRNV